MAATPITFQSARQIDLYRAVRTSSIPVSIEALEQQASARMAPAVREWINGGAGGNYGVRENVAAFERWRIMPRVLRDITARDAAVDLFGHRIHVPWLLAPVGVQRLLHPEGELATAHAAAEAGVPFVLSTVSSYTIEEVARANGSGCRWFQLYWSKDPELTLSLIRRAERAGYSAIVVTLDTQILGWRERSLDHGFLPFLQGEGLANYFSDPVFRSGLRCPAEEDLDAAVRHYLGVFSNLTHTWKDLKFLRDRTRLPLLLKGVQHADDALRAADAGVDGLVVSNHGGRQVEGGIATIDALPPICAALKGALPVLVDGGIRRGADVFRAVALGAAATLIGRPYLWALVLSGEKGVLDLLLNLAADLDLTMALSGRTELGQISAEDVFRRI